MYCDTCSFRNYSAQARFLFQVISTTIGTFKQNCRADTSIVIMSAIRFSLNKHIILNALTLNKNHCEYQKDCESSRWRRIQKSVLRVWSWSCDPYLQINQWSFNHRRLNNCDCYVSNLRESRLLHQVIIKCSNFVFYLTQSCLLRSFSSILFSI